MMDINLLRGVEIHTEPELSDHASKDFDLLDRPMRRIFFQAVGGKAWKYPAIYIRYRVDGKEKRRAIPIRSYIDKLEGSKPDVVRWLTDLNQWFIVSTPWTPIKPPTA